MLVVIGPGVRLPYLGRALARRILDGDRMMREITTTVDHSHHLVADDRHLVLLSWQKVLTAIQIELAGEQAVVADVQQLLGLCERMDTEAFIPITNAELTATVYRRVHEFGAVVDDVAAQLAAESDRVLDLKRWHQVRGNGLYGRYALLRGVPVLLHVSTDKWTNLAPNPIWLTVYGSNWTTSGLEPIKRLLSTLETREPGTVHWDHDNFPTIMMRVRPGRERHEVVADLAEQVRGIGELLAPLGATPSSADPPNERETA